MDNKKLKILLIFFNIFSFLILLTPIITKGSSSLDSLNLKYSIAANNYDIKLLKEVEINIQNKRKNLLPEEQLLLGLVYWRYQLISYCNNALDDVITNGEIAIQELTKAEKMGADLYICASYKALTYLLMAGTTLKNGATYIYFVSEELKKAQKFHPEGYFTKLIKAIKVNQTPSIVGGNPYKAVDILEKMSVDFPDSVDVKIHLAEAYLKIGKREEAKKILNSVLNSNPSNLLAKKIFQILKEKEKF